MDSFDDYSLFFSEGNPSDTGSAEFTTDMKVKSLKKNASSVPILSGHVKSV